MSVPRVSPPTPETDRPQTQRDHRFELIQLPSEWIEAYRPGGYHPIHLGDKLNEGRFKILRKLGFGSFSTVWLAKDSLNDSLVAIKIKTADSSSCDSELEILKLLGDNTSNDERAQFISSLVTFFTHHGPNGEHHCLVFKPLGGSVSALLEELPENQALKKGQKARYPPWMVKRILYQTLMGLSLLHDNDIAHGDLQLGNIMCSLEPPTDEEISDWEEDDQDEATEDVTRKDGESDRWAPRYVVLVDPLFEFTNLGEGLSVKISDFGAAFVPSSQVKKPTIPLSFRAPELIFESNFDIKIDIWSFGCIFFYLLTGVDLFSVFQFLGDDIDACNESHLMQLVELLGPLPKDLLLKWPRSKKYFKSDGTLNSMSGGQNATYKPLESYFAANKPADLNNEEEKIVLSLLRSMLQYDAAARPSASELLTHPWFKKAADSKPLS